MSEVELNYLDRSWGALASARPNWPNGANPANFPQVSGQVSRPVGHREKTNPLTGQLTAVSR